MSPGSVRSSCARDETSSCVRIAFEPVATSRASSLIRNACRCARPRGHSATRTPPPACAGSLHCRADHGCPLRDLASLAAADRARQGARELRGRQRSHADGRERSAQRLRRRHGRADPGQGPRPDARWRCSGSRASATSCRTTSPATIRESVVARRRARAGARPLDAGQAPAPLPIEAVVRGYLAGSGWKEYQASGAGLRRDAAAGAEQRVEAAGADLHAGDQGRDGRARREHRLRARRATSSATISRRRCATPRSASTARRPSTRSTRGIVIADTKFEFGLDDARHADADGRGADARLVALLAGGRRRSRAATRRASTSSSCATGSRACASTARRGTRRAPAPPLPAEVVRADRGDTTSAIAAILIGE